MCPFSGLALWRGGGSKETHLQSQDLCYVVGIGYCFASNYLKTRMSRRPLSDGMVDIPEPGLSDECKSSRFRVNNTFLFFVEMGEVELARDSKAACVREVASVSFVDPTGRWDLSVRAIF